MDTADKPDGQIKLPPDLSPLFAEQSEGESGVVRGGD